ncbi:PSD1 and planctomycete cytochrome C domain-containing protein [Singulisphaera acidiphila]|uniref:Cytochrome c domain-containing protein n=3 Tax=Singulisphaera acidiphila TaxID=466153 RepID=L0DRD0_SINAD|nr:PSD1 and planctomycete cytochrome C domain-containing protein [Singulisphaera acidiphila]AGA31532.1 Protein of unknown function (DUF1553)/Protein of unknown function (DUF1549)/Planctomycete cytochrome C [Singulisphaera acidiphila DSM 18658]
MKKCLVAFLGGLLAGPVAAIGADDRLFREQVAPMLEARCVGCHSGPSPKAKLSLATAKGLEAGGESGAAVVPGRPEESLLLDSISGEPPEMPKTGGPLEPAQVASVRAWIAQGAHWPEGLTLQARRPEAGAWWAFRPLVRPKLPMIVRQDWLRTPIDAFILSRLEEKGLVPSPEADRRTLIRRLTFDLHGLPPTPQEADDFVGDPRPDAYERLVDRLLASPRYGERWGRHWLDVVHYGDTHGYDKDKRRDHAWPYRDYVIQSLNDDVPYARFIQEQIAGDVLWPGDPRGVIATGFVAAGPWDFVGHIELREGTVDKEKARLNDRDDMLASTMSTFQSLTVHCARCHDHKFDPIPQKDYYRLQAVFAGVERGERPFLGRESAAKRAAIEASKEDLTARLASLKAKADATTSPELVQLDDELGMLRGQLAALPGPKSSALSPSNGYHSGIAPTPDVVKWVQVDLGRAVPIDEVRLFPARPTDFADTPGFGFPVRFRVELADEPTFARPVVIVDQSMADFTNPGLVPYLVRPRPGQASARFLRVTASRLWKRTDDYVFALGELDVISEGRRASVAAVTALDSIEAGRWGRARLVDGFNSRTSLEDLADPVARERLALQYQLQETRSRYEALKESQVDTGIRDGIDRTVTELSALDGQVKALLAADQVYAVVARTPRTIHLLNRGDVEQPGEVLGPGALSCLAGLDSDFSATGAKDEGARRVALAEWIGNVRNVLTWRSIANRLWHGHFGRGLVDTPNDFGRNGSTPSHPELLDWLATELLDNGQSLKGLHRAIVCSATYRQSSRHEPNAAAQDGDNRWLWRMNRTKLDAESLRDGVLAVSGTLDSKMGGPGFEPFRFKDDHSPIYDHGDPARTDSPETRRRTVYRFIVRSVPHPFLESLDCADPNINTPVRAATISPLQALALLNDRFMIQQSRAFAHRLEALSDDPVRRIDEAYHLALGRPPRLEEREVLAAFATKHGLANACRLLLNTNEFVFVD